MAGVSWWRPSATAEKIIKELGCASCHFGLPEETSIRQKAPSLSHAGLRFNPAYLFDYLQDPSRVRHHIGLSRMPDFHLDKKESLALVLFLDKQAEVPGRWPEFPSDMAVLEDTSKAVNLAELKTLVDQFECIKCHSLNGEGKNESIDLTTAGYRLKQDWLQNYLVAPYVFDGLQTSMPSYFYQHDVTQNRFVTLLPDAAESISDLTSYFFSLSKKKRRQLQEKYNAMKDANPDISAAMGERIFRSLNCAACHESSTPNAWLEKNAPDLSLEGRRVKQSWLRDYLKKPMPLRPFGYYPGSGSRMPDFDLTDDEVDELTRFLLEQKSEIRFSNRLFQRRSLSAFSMAKAERLLKEKLSCLGCHQLGREGGRIAPDLSNIKSRLQDEFVYQFVRNPHLIIPETVMPRIELPEKTLNLITNYLMSANVQKSKSSYLSLVDNEVYFYGQSGETRDLYLKNCASCHGINAAGNGFNSKYLPGEPFRDSDAILMSGRPDDTLFDGIYAGGYILNRSHFMPPWGSTLQKSDIRKLVAYLRELCQCAGPMWSRDNK